MLVCKISLLLALYCIRRYVLLISKEIPHCSDQKRLFCFWYYSYCLSFFYLWFCKYVYFFRHLSFVWKGAISFLTGKMTITVDGSKRLQQDKNLGLIALLAYTLQKMSNAILLVYHLFNWVWWKSFNFQISDLLLLGF